MIANQQFIIISFSIFFFPLISLVNLMETPSQRFAQYDTNHYQKSTHSECYDSDGMAQRCVPDFGNAAFNLPISVSRPEFTCGFRRPSKYCIQTGNLGILNRICSVCDNRITHQSHPPIFLTDFHTSSNETFWQSETMEEGIHKFQVNLTLQLGKAFDITYVRLRFAAPRPESFVIYKRTRAEDQWQPWQFYSGSCRSTFGLPEKAPIIPANEAMAQCTREFSDISPLTGGDIAFSTLEGRPSAVNFEESEVLQKWVTATEIMISLVRLNTYGDEIWGDPRVLRTYFYAITDFAVGGRCKCNGHANKCVKSTGQGELQKLVCDCQHNTVGVDCQECAPFYMDRPWRPATSIEANECLPCNCNGLSQRCFFDAKLFEATGHGGHCIDCVGNTEGVHCENCVPGYWRHSSEKYCRPCNCDLTGSLNSQCSPKDGQCVCKPGVGGQRCDQCLAGFYGFGEFGCKECNCDPDGTFEGQQCSPSDGRCSCKPNVEGKHCERCKPGYFLLSADNPFGCFPCFCFGHSSVCSASDGFYARNISANFLANIEGWKGANFENGKTKSLEIQYDPNEKAISVGQECDRFSYFLAPSKFLGDQRLAYGQFLHFSLRKLSSYGSWSSQDLQLIGANGRILSLPLGAQGNPAPSNQLQHYQFRIHADPRLQWNPQLREIDFIEILSNLSEIRLRATYSRGDVGFLSHFSIGSASEGLHPEEGIPRRRANWVEQCECPPSFAGQFCQFCAPQNKRAHPFGGPLTKCVPCQCNGHAKSCDPESGICECAHNTAGDSCEHCARGYYGDALAGTPNDCKPCGCPGGGSCLQMDDEDGLILCTECSEGYSGPRCEYCSEEYFGDPQAGRPCKKCDCNGNVDPNAIGQCDQLTGECRRCIHQTIGWNCERCRPGFWGNAMEADDGSPKIGCNPCNCYAPGTQRTGAGLDIFGEENVLECAQGDGQCTCLPNVVGKQCDKCAVGFFNITSGMGCQPCECDPLGSLNVSNCDLYTGQCECKNGVIGQKCDQCAQKHFGFGISGCAKCICHRHGAEFEECDIRNGQCLCKDWVEGRQCDRCAENHYNLEAGCPPCDDCYSLIQNRKASIIGKMAEFDQQLDDFRTLPIPLNDSAKFDASIQEHFNRLQRLEERTNLLEDSKLVEYYKMAKSGLNATMGHLEGGKKWMVGFDRNLAEIEGKLGKFGREKSAIQREIAIYNNKIDSTENELIKQEKEQQKMAGRRTDAEIKLSKMAKIAEDMAKKQEEKKAQILEITKEIIQKKKMALEESKQAVYGDGENGGRDLGVNSTIHSKLNDLELVANQTRQELDKTLEKAKENNAEANEVYNEMALNLEKIKEIKVPKKQINPLAMLNELRKEFGGIEKELELTMEKGKEMEKNARGELDVAKEALAEAKRRMNTVEKELELSTEMEKRTLEAKEKADNALENTKAILKALEEGHDAEKLANMKEQYQKEMSLSRGLAKQLAQTQRKLNKAERELKNVQNKAERALKLSLNAEKRAKLMAKENLPGLLENVENMQIRLNSLSKEMNDLEEAIQAEEKLNGDMNAGELITKIVDAHHGAVSDVKSGLDMKNTTEKNEQILMKLLERLTFIDSMSPSNDDELDLVEAELEKLEKAYADSGFEQIEERFKQLTAEKAQFQEQIIHLNEELGQLKNTAISLPLKCFNKVNIEQNGQ